MSRAGPGLFSIVEIAAFEEISGITGGLFYFRKLNNLCIFSDNNVSF